MMISQSKLDFINEHKLNEFQENYIYALGGGTFEQMEEVVSGLDEEVTFQTVLDYSAIVALHTFDFATESLVEERVKNGFYTMLHFEISDSDIKMTVLENNIVEYTLTMSNEHYIIMSLLGTLDEMANYIIEEGIAGVFIVNNTSGHELFRV